MADEHVNHPAHYGGADNPYEVIRVIEAWALGFNLGNTVKYIGRAGKKGGPWVTLEDLRKAAWYLNREIEKIQKEIAHDESGGADGGGGGARVSRAQSRRRAGVRAGRS